MKEWIFILILSLKTCLCLSFPRMALLDESISSNGFSNNSMGLVPELNSSTRIVAGYPATLGPPATAPWQVALVYGDVYLFCGGTLLSYQVVVTAAHCIEAIGEVRFTVQLGGLKSSSLPLKYNINHIFVHSDYDGCDQPLEGGPFACDNDIALLILDNDEDFTSYSYIEPVNLPPAFDEDEHANEIVRVSGWGKTSYTAQTTSDYLMAVELILQPDSVCKHFADPTYVNYTENMICASGEYAGSIKNACQGDSGGPLVLRGNTSNTLLGIVSWGVECSVYPGVYTKVTNYVSWIKEKADEGGAPLDLNDSDNSGIIKNSAGLILVMLTSSLVTLITV